MHASVRESIGDRLRRLRLERGLSQRELSEPGLSYAYISRIEAGARNPSIKVLRRLAVKLGVPVEELETGRAAVRLDGAMSEELLAAARAAAREHGIGEYQPVRVTVQAIDRAELAERP